MRSESSTSEAEFVRGEPSIRTSNPVSRKLEARIAHANARLIGSSTNRGRSGDEPPAGTNPDRDLRSDSAGVTTHEMVQAGDPATE